MGADCVIPDGRPSELYEVRGRGGCKAQVLVDSSTQEIYCAIAPVLSLRGWPIQKLRDWISSKEGWSLTHLGPGAAVTALQSV